MISKILPLAVIAGCAFLSSCIQEESLNAECDITGVDSAWVKANIEAGVLHGYPEVENNSVRFTVANGADRTAFAPSFYLSPGAKIFANVNGSLVEANGMTRDFTTPQVYTTYAEDGIWHKDYTVSFNYAMLLGKCSFENVDLDASKKYNVFYENDASDPNNPRRDYWASGNGGFALTGMAKEPSEYPTVTWAEGKEKRGVKLETLSTGSFGQGVKMPIAAGNLFIGQFKTAQAMLFPRQATLFGRQLVTDKPIALSGWYKYKAGEKYTDGKQNVHPELHDTCDIYAVLYEVDPKKFVPLDGDNILTSDRIVSIARIDNPGEPSDWTYFKEPFKPRNGKEFDYSRIANYGYAIAIVMTSSRQGAYFEGAIGSTLYVDEITIEWEGDAKPDNNPQNARR